MAIRPATLKEFQDKTSILPGVVAKTVLDRRGAVLRAEDRGWFVEHVEHRTLQLFNVNRTWRQKLNSGNGGLDFLYVFVGHWLDAFLLNPEQFKERHQLPRLARRAS